MNIYNFKGEELTNVYNFKGNELDSAYDFKGNEIYTSIEPISIEEVNETFRSSCLEAMEYINSLDSGYANYIVLTDTHYATNFGHSANVSNYLYSSGKFDKLIHLGDLLNDTNVGESDWLNMVETNLLHFEKRWLFTQGNHDNHLSPLENATVYFEPSSVHYTINDMHNAYYYDNTKHKIRFLCLHHYLYANSSIRNEVEEWIKYKPSGYKWAILEHYPFNNGTWEESSCIGTETQSWLFNLIELYSGFIGNFCGHLHLDKHDVLNSGTKDFNQMVFDSDASGGRTDDINGHVITIMSINPTTENVKFYRIGRSSVYDTKQWEFNGFTS